MTRTIKQPHLINKIPIITVSNMLDISVKTLRNWDNEDIFPAVHSKGNHRFYNEEDILPYFPYATKLKPNEAADKLGISLQTLNKWTKENSIPSHEWPTGRKFYLEEEMNNVNVQALIKPKGRKKSA